MKSFILTLVLILSVAGCGSRQPGMNQVQPSAVGNVKTAAVQSSAKTDNDVKKPPVYTGPEAVEGPKLQFSQQGVTFSWVEKGQVRMSATAREVKGGEVTKIGELSDFSGKLYENGRLVASMTAPKVVADTVNRVVTATGGVVLKSVERNTTVRSQWMKWYAREQKVIGNGGVKISSTMGNMQGAAFVVDTGMKSIVVKDSAEGL